MNTNPNKPLPVGLSDDRRMSDFDWDLLPKPVAAAVRSWCIKNNFVGDDGHISYVYANCAIVAIEAAALARLEALHEDKDDTDEN